jgi:hypothetical protein
MIVGNRSLFAVEFEIDKDYGGAWLFGKVCYWVKNKSIGDYDMGTSLRDILFLVDIIVQDNGNRNHEDLFELDASELFARLDETLFGYEASPYDDVAVKETWARFNIGLPVDVFDDWKLYLVDGTQKSRILFKNINEEKINEAELAIGEFDEVILRVHQELIILYSNEITSD